LLIGLWALAMGFQSAAIMSLGVASVFTTAVTATFIGLISDLAGWSHPENQERRFTGVLFGLLVGAVAGAWLFLHANDVAPLLPLIVLMLVIAAAEYAMKPAR
jgi:uncharacterized membrane protein YoaK (UPF0700 family)